MPADPADNGTFRSELERLILAAVGAVALTGERADALADALAARGNLRRDEARETIDTLLHRWRGDASRVGERAGSALETTFRELGLVPRRDVEELELRLAQIEHRLRLLEAAEGAAPPEPRRPAV